MWNRAITWPQNKPFLTIHLSAHELTCCLIQHHPFSLVATHTIPLVTGAVNKHIFNQTIISSTLKSFLNKLSVERPITLFSCTEPLITESITRTKTETTISQQLNESRWYTGILSHETLFQLQLICLKADLHCSVITSKKRALHETMIMHQKNKGAITAATIQEYNEYLQEKLSHLLPDSLIEISPDICHDLYQETINEAVGLYSIGKRLYGTR